MVEPAGPPLRVAFFGTPEFAVPTLRALVASRHAVAGVVTQPDKPRGRGQRVSESPVAEVARAEALPVLRPERLKDEAFLEAFREWNADLGVVAAYGKILPAALLAIPRLGLINVHASLLPRYRGAAPIHRSVMAGDAETGVSIMRVVQALDAGGVFATVRAPIGPDDTSADVEAALSASGARLLVEIVDALAAGTAAETPQDADLATYAHRLQKTESPLDWSRAAQALHDQVRGLHPWPLACTWLNGHRLIVLRTRVAAALDVADDDEPGTVVAVTRDCVRVQTGRGAIELLMLQPEGRRPMGARDFAAGHRILPGARFDGADAALVPDANRV
jgi:methionyl-tRNA formyltransferase